MTPSQEFYENLRLMENLFKCYHGEKGLKPGKGCMSNLSMLISRHIRLPEEVVAYFVRLRVFLRIRVLNRNIRDTSNKAQKKVKQLMNRVDKK